METLISVAVLGVSLTLLWSGRQRLEFNSFQTTLLSILEFFGVVVSVVGLGWLGVAIFAVLNVIATLVWATILAARKQSILIGATVRSADMSRDEAEELFKWMNRHGAFAAVGPIERAELIRALAGQARSPAEIRPMSVSISHLAVIFERDPLWLVPRFDQLLRLYGESASDSEKVADTLTAATKNSAASFKDMVDAMIIAGGGSISTGNHEAVIGSQAA
jgi:hypothetical protein